MNIVEENRRLRSEIEDLKKTLTLREKMTFKEPFYFQEGDETPFCPACWELKNSPIHLVFIFSREDAVRWDCPVCHHGYMDKKDRGVRRPFRNEPPPWS